MQIAQLEFQVDDTILTQRVLRLRVGALDVQVFMDRIAGRLRDKVAVPGFRKGKGPLAQVRKHYSERVATEAFEEIKRVALEQVMKELRDEDKPFLPPEVIEREKIRLRYGQPLELSLKYLVHPGNPISPAAHDTFDPLSHLHGQAVANGRSGIPGHPVVPAAVFPAELPTPPDIPEF